MLIDARDKKLTSRRVLALVVIYGLFMLVLGLT